MQRRSVDQRLARLTHDAPLPRARVLEFGPAENPTTLPDGYRIEYVDHCMRPEGWDESWASVDHVWTGGGSFAAVCGPYKTYDFAIAAQVAQYVPNLLGWFKGIFDVLDVGGVLNLSLPDYRFTFDCGRAVSSVAEAVEAYLLDFSRPSLRQLFDHTYGARGLYPGQRWNDDVLPEAVPRLSGDTSLEFAFEQCRDVVASRRYVQCHCWVFSPISFLSLIEEASRLALFPFVVNQFCSTEPGGFEFYVSLRRDAETDPALLLAKQRGAIAYVRGVAERQIRFARRISEA